MYALSQPQPELRVLVYRGWFCCRYASPTPIRERPHDDIDSRLTRHLPLAVCL